MMRSTLHLRSVIASTTSSRPAGPPPPLPAVFAPIVADRDVRSFPVVPLPVTSSTSRRGRSRTPPRYVPVAESVHAEANGRAHRRIDVGDEVDTGVGLEAILVDNEVDADAVANTDIVDAVDVGIDALFAELDDVQSALVVADDPRSLGSTPALDARLNSRVGGCTSR